MTGLTVVKCGGNQAVDADAVCADVAALAAAGRRIVLAHGGSADIDALADRLGVPRRRLTAPDGVGARYTDAATLEVVTLALAGAVKPRLVSALQAHGVKAAGLTGLDGGLLQARRKAVHRAVVDGRTVLVRDDHSGVIEHVDPSGVIALMDAGFVPVLSPPAVDREGRAVNVDADRAAAALAGALGADELVLLTGAPGVLSDPSDRRTLLELCEVPPSGAPGGFARGGMAAKLIAAREALLGGVGRVLVADGRGGTPVSSALGGAGTRVVLAGALAAGGAR